MNFGAQSKVPQPLDTDEVLYSGSDDDYYESPAERQRRCAIQARRYLEGKPVTILSAQLKGPFDQESGWTNPWRSRHEPGKKQLPKPAVTKNRVPQPAHDDQPNGESFITVAESSIKQKPAPRPLKAPTLQRMSSGNISLELSPRKPQTGSSSFQLPSPGSSTSYRRPINPWMNDEAWSRVQAWREAVRPEYGSGEAKEVSALDKGASPSPRAGRKRPATAEFLRKALASSKRLKSNELEYSTPASPSPVKKSLPIKHPDSSGTFGPAQPSTPGTKSVRRGHALSSSFRQEATMHVSTPTKDTAVSRAPLVDYSSSYDTVPDDPDTIVLPHRTPTKPAPSGLRQTRSQEEATSPSRGQPRSTFEQRLLSSPKVRLSTAVHEPSTPRRESKEGRSEIRLGTPRVSPHFTKAREPATPNGKTESPRQAGTAKQGTLTRTREELELEFQSQADRSFQFRVKVRKAVDQKGVSKPNTVRSTPAKVSSVCSDDPAPDPPTPADHCDESADAGVPCDMVEGENTSEDETASTQSDPDDTNGVDDETSEEPVQAEVVEGDAVEVLVEADIPAGGVLRNDDVEAAVAAEPPVVAEPVAADALEDKTVEDRSMEEDLIEDAGSAVLILDGPPLIPTSSVPEPKPEGGQEPQAPEEELNTAAEDDAAGKQSRLSPSFMEEIEILKASQASQPNPASSPYVADLGDHHILPPLLLSFSPLSSFFGNREDSGPGTQQNSTRKGGEAELQTPSQPICPNTESILPESVVPRALPEPSPASSEKEMPQEESNDASDDDDKIGLGPQQTLEPEEQDKVYLDAQTQNASISASPVPVSEPEVSVSFQTPQQQSPWHKEVLTVEQAEQPATPVEHQQGRLEKTPVHQSAQLHLEAMHPLTHSHTHTTTRPATADPSVGRHNPSQQSPWMETALTPIVPNVKMMDDVRFSSTQLQYQPVESSLSQNPWRQNITTTPNKMLLSSPTGRNRLAEPHSHSHPFRQLSSPTSQSGVSACLQEEYAPKDIMSDEPATPPKQSSLPTPDFTLSVKSFRAFQTPSPERRRSRPRPTGHHDHERTESILKSSKIRYSDIDFPARMNIKKFKPKRHVTFAPELDMGPSSSFADDAMDDIMDDSVGAELPTREATRSPPSRCGRGRVSSPPLQLSQSELPGATDRFYSHFAKMVRKGPQMRRRGRTSPKSRKQLLPSASQQTCGSPGFDAMAEAFIQADQAKLDNAMEDDPPEYETKDVIPMDFEMDKGFREESQSQAEPHDPVAHVMNNLDSFIGMFDVDAELRRAGTDMDGERDTDRGGYLAGNDDMEMQMMGYGVWD